MFEYFQISAGPEVEVVGYEPPEVLLRSRQPLELGVTPVRADVAGVKMKARVKVVEVEADHARCVWLSPSEALPYLSDLFPLPEKRRSPRTQRALRVKSLLGMQGWSIDLSREGMRLETQGGFELGQTFPLTIDLDDAFDTRLQLQAGVRWCAPSLTSGWTVAGLEYVEAEPGSQQEMETYRRFLDKLSRVQQDALERQQS